MEMPINERVAIGSNSLAYEQALRQDIEIVLCDDHEKLFHFAKWHIEDYIQGTEGMQLEIEGAYIRFLMRLYRRGKPLPDDDRFMSIAMGLSLRVWKRIKDSLISIGKIICRAGYLTNPRFEKERRERADQLRKQAEGAHKRWEEQRKREAAKREVSANFSESLAKVSPKLSAKDAEKLNEINETDHSQPHILNIDIEEDKNNNPPIVPPTHDEQAFDLQAEEAGKPKKRARDAIPDEYPYDFEEFWKVYPRREGKALAFKRWQKLNLGQKRRAYVALKRQLEFLTAKTRDRNGNLCPHAATWLNQGRFDDDPVHAEPAAPPGKFKSYAEQEGERIQKFIDACGSSSSG